MNIFKRIWAAMTPSKISLEEQYYSGACDLIDLEMRMRRVQRGTAPFQLYNFHRIST